MDEGLRVAVGFVVIFYPLQSVHLCLDAHIRDVRIFCVNLLILCLLFALVTVEQCFQWEFSWC